MQLTVLGSQLFGVGVVNPEPAVVPAVVGAVVGACVAGDEDGDDPGALVDGAEVTGPQDDSH